MLINKYKCLRLIIIFSVFGCSTSAFSLSCARSLTVEDELRLSDDVFIGVVDEIISIEKVDNSNPWDAELKVVANLLVEKVIKGKVRETQRVLFSSLAMKGERYLIVNSSAYTSMCTFSLSRPLVGARRELQILGVIPKIESEE